ncbi:hypothetical protein BX666DRAFT_2014826, partial [Dichotomocladium elegans]
HPSLSYRPMGVWIRTFLHRAARMYLLLFVAELQNADPLPPSLCANQCHGGERRKYVKTQRKKTRLVREEPQTSTLS